jgi:hypothetical protein
VTYVQVVMVVVVVVVVVVMDTNLRRWRSIETYGQIRSACAWLM